MSPEERAMTPNYERNPMGLSNFEREELIQRLQDGQHVFDAVDAVLDARTVAPAEPEESEEEEASSEEE